MKDPTIRAVVKTPMTRMVRVTLVPLTCLKVLNGGSMGRMRE